MINEQDLIRPTLTYTKKQQLQHNSYIGSLVNSIQWLTTTFQDPMLWEPPQVLQFQDWYKIERMRNEHKQQAINMLNTLNIDIDPYIEATEWVTIGLEHIPHVPSIINHFLQNTPENDNDARLQAESIIQVVDAINIANTRYHERYDEYIINPINLITAVNSNKRVLLWASRLIQTIGSTIDPYEANEDTELIVDWLDQLEAIELTLPLW